MEKLKPAINLNCITFDEMMEVADRCYARAHRLQDIACDKTETKHRRYKARVLSKIAMHRCEAIISHMVDRGYLVPKKPVDRTRIN